MEKLDKQSREEIKWFISNSQIRPRLLKNLYGIDNKTLQEIIDAHFVGINP